MTLAPPARRNPVRAIARLALLALALSAFGPAAAQPASPWFAPTRVDDAPLIAPVRTHHSGEFGHTAIRYDAIAGELVLNGEDGQPAATMFATAYVRTDPGAQSNRPVLFLFNGGPGASSSPLHLGIGPMRRPHGDDDGALAPDPLSPLDAVDMVFVDPAGTGYTRLLEKDAGEQFWGIEADANVVLYLVRTWLDQNGRTGSPVFLLGESYGGTRAVAMAAQARNVKISGLLLLSPALDFTAGTEVVGNNLPYIFLLPSMAATAAYHGVVDRDGRSYQEVFDTAAQFAQADYAAALYKGHTIGAEEKASVARRMSAFIGLPEDYILAHNLRVDRGEFGDRLLGAQGIRVGKLDGRAKGPIAEYKDKRPPGNDPAMSGRHGGRSSGELLDEYFAGQLSVHAPWPYRTLNLDLNMKWDYGQKSGRLKTYYTVAPQLQEAMQSNPSLRVFVGGGVFDMGVPIMAARYTVNQIDAAPDRFEFAGFDAGHTVFEDEPGRAALCRNIREFVHKTIERAASP